MLRVGVTGGIGSGKSSVAEMMGLHGATVIDADRIARSVLAPGTSAVHEVFARFGATVRSTDGSLDRAALAAIVFADPAALHDLEAITHPRIWHETARLFAAAPPDAVVVHDMPLIVEKSTSADYHLVIVVMTGVETRVRRLVARGLTEADARARIGAQATDDQRRAAADAVVGNDGTPEELAVAVAALWSDRVLPFAENLHAAICSRHPEPPHRSDSDPRWREQAERLLARLRRAGGDVIVTADHVGNTAIPGLPAKDVIDLQLGVRSLDAADDPHLVRRLREAGFPRADGVGTDAGRGSHGSWPERMHGNADPGRVAQVDVRVAGGPGWRWALLFRDWMRADAVAREAYRADCRIGGRADTAGDHAAAEEPRIDAVAATAEEWAARTGWRPPEIPESV